MSTSTGAFGLAAHTRRKSSGKASSFNFVGSAAVGSLVLSCAWMVYTNIFAASVYPTIGGANIDSPVIRRSASVAVRAASPATHKLVTALSEPPAISAPETVPAGSSLSFDDRFAAAAPRGVDPSPRVEAPKLAEVSPRAETPKLAEAPKARAETQKVAEAPRKETPASAPVRVAAIAPAELKAARSPGSAVRDMAQRAKAAVLSITGVDKPSMVEKLWGKPQSSPSLLSYASADASATGSLGPTQNPALAGAQPRYERDTAVYDISAHMVYLPDGTRLEAHSGLGSMLDDPRSARIRMRGVTPPHLYDLKPREALFHGVPALRLNPVGGEGAIFGRSGLLAHTYMLGPNGDSNGCVSFRDYNAFLNAYRNQGIRRLAVVARVE
jgi:Protein of unknown function (DUF2778)